MKTTKLFSIGLVAIMIVSFSEQTFAQLVDFYSSPNYSNFINTLQANNILKSSTANYTKEKNKENFGLSKSESPGQASPPEVLAYRRYPAV